MFPSSESSIVSSGRIRSKLSIFIGAKYKKIDTDELKIRRQDLSPTSPNQTIENDRLVYSQCLTRRASRIMCQVVCRPMAFRFNAENKALHGLVNAIQA